MSEAIGQRSDHFGIAEDAGPLTECEVGGDNDRGALVEPADEVEQELATRLSEGQITELVEHDEVQSREVIGQSALAAIARLGLETVDGIDDVVEAAAGSGTDAAPGSGDGEMGLSGARPSNQDGLRWLAMKPPPARSRTRVSLIGVPANSKSSRSLASGSLAMVS
jgi:hypothetical protein